MLPGLMQQGFSGVLSEKNGLMSTKYTGERIRTHNSTALANSTFYIERQLFITFVCVQIHAMMYMWRSKHNFQE